VLSLVVFTTLECQFLCRFSSAHANAHHCSHCASHPKRVILVSSVVITSLFYPALALYSSSNPTYALSFLSTLFDAYQSDLHEIWESHDELHILADAATRARCGMERTLRIERVLVPSSEWTPAGAATPATLQFASKLDDRIGGILRDAKSPLSCVRTANKQCLVLSPMLLFDRGIPSTTTEILKTINASPNVSVSDIQIGVPMLFSGRSFTDDRLNTVVEHVTFLALTYFFLEKDCLASDGHDRWLKTLETTTLDGQGSSSVTPFVFQKPRFLALRHDPTLSQPSHFSAISLLLYLSYLGVFLSFSGSLRRMDTVHSRFGLTFTALVEIIASTIGSVSVCALAGFRITMVPWYVCNLLIANMLLSAMHQGYLTRHHSLCRRGKYVPACRCCHLDVGNAFGETAYWDRSCCRRHVEYAQYRFV
jgi:Sterol-sensing domain of SREBP cleavage-activation